MPNLLFIGSGSASQSDSSMVRVDQPEKPHLVNFDPLVPEKKVSKGCPAASMTDMTPTGYQGDEGTHAIP